MPLKHLVPAKGRLKQAETTASLAAMVKKMTPGARLPRVRELARALEVSLATLDTALKQLETRHMIERRPKSGIFVSPRIHQKTIGLVMGAGVFGSGGVAHFYSTMLNMCMNICSRRAESHGEHMSFYLNLPALNSDSPATVAHPDLVQALASGKLDGLLTTGFLGDAFSAWLKSHGVPVVGTNKVFGRGSVVVDYESIIRMGACELVKEGCKTLALVGARIEDSVFFREAAADLGFRHDGAGVLLNEDWKPQEYADRLLAYFKKQKDKKSPCGLVLTDDSFASSILPLLAASGLKIGRRLKIATHANKGTLLLSEWKNKLILLEIDPEEMAEAMFSRLAILMDGGKPEPAILHIRPRVRR